MYLAISLLHVCLQADMMISKSYENLARLSVFISAARYDEMTSQHDPHHVYFELLFHRLEADQVGGLYTVMCALVGVFHSLPGPERTLIGADVKQQIRMIRVHWPHNQALRHLLNYTVATSIFQVAQRLARDARQLTQQY